MIFKKEIIMSFGKAVYKIVTSQRKSILANGPFSVHYPKKGIVYAPKYTIGLMCFETKADLYKWVAEVNHLGIVINNADIIIKCQPLTKVYKPECYNTNYGIIDLMYFSRLIKSHGLQAFFDSPEVSTRNEFNIVLTQCLKVLN